MANTRQSRRIAIIDCLIGINALVGLATFIGAVWINPTNVRLLISAWSAFCCFFISGVLAFTLKSALEYCTTTVSRSRHIHISMSISCISAILGFASILYTLSDILKIKLETTFHSWYLVIITIVPVLIILPLIVYIALIVIFYSFIKDED
jgi:hypothetical protein